MKRRIAEADLSWLSKPEVFAVNRIKAHSDHWFYKKREEIGMEEDMPLKQSLNGEWLFSYSDSPIFRKKDFYKESYDYQDFKKINVPGHIQLQGYDQCQYINIMYPWDGQEELLPPQISENNNPVGSYVKFFNLNENLEKEKRIFLSFQGVETAFYVWLNGKFVGYGEDSFTPSEFEITDYIKNGSNKLCVEVYKRSSASWIEDQDFWRFSGIFRDVYLYAIPTGHVRDIFVRAIPDTDYASRKGELNINMELEGSVNQILFCLLDQEGKEAAHKIIDAEVNSNITISVENINMWSAEVPYLYDLRVELLDHCKEMIEIVPVKVGFRRFEIIDKIMCLNGKRILFKGVNRHEFNAFRGRAITKEDMLWDICFLKQNNINAVRTSHYPNNSMWYRLCDKYGIYLIDETNLESHGSWQKFDKIDPSWNVPGNLPEWKENVLDRVQSMFERDKNHPSVLIWSCGNESYAGEDILLMSKFFKEKDNTRLVHYEGVFHNRLFDEISDMESRMYAKPEEIEEYLKSNPQKPYISCEYMHAMGNSCGGMHLYTDLEKKYPMYQGGFIWDYIDQAIFRIKDDKEEILSYGGDFDDRATDYGFCTNGIVYADRRPTPKVQEVKYLYQNVKMSKEEEGLRIKNDNLFISTDAFDLIYWIQQEEHCLSKGMLKTKVRPGEEKVFVLPEIKTYKEGEYTVNVSMRLKETTLWASKGHEVAFAQKILRNNYKSFLPKDTDYMKVVHGDGHIGIRGKGFSMLFSKKEGGLVSLIYDGTEYITRSPKTSYWRALTDNDRGCRLEWECAMWQNAGAFQKLKHFQILEENNEKLTLVYTFELPTVPVTYNTVSYTVIPSGKIFVTVKYKGNKNLPEIPVFAMDFKLKKEIHFFKYYGMGPEENYADRKEGARLGIFLSDAVSNYSAYLVPQECGNRTGVRWLKVTDGGEKGLYFSSEKGLPFEMSVLPYSAYELENALHKEELPKINYTWVRIAGCQMGVGGDDSWGAPVHEEYRISSEKDLEFTFCINRIQ